MAIERPIPGDDITEVPASPVKYRMIMPEYKTWDESGRALFILPPGMKFIRDSIVLKNRRYRNATLDPDENLDESVDDILGNFLSSEIQTRIDSNRVPISIMDVGGGYRSVAASEIAREYGDKVKVTNLDIFHEWQVGDDTPVERVLGDIMMPPIPEESQDIIYSSFVLRYVPNEVIALAMISSMLKPGGVAILHEEKFIELDKEDPELVKLGSFLGVSVEPVRLYEEATAQIASLEPRLAGLNGVLILRRPGN